MPTGANLPFLTYKDTGIQSVNTTLTPIDDENVVSQFLSQKSRVYLSGSNDVVLPENIPSDKSITNMPTDLTFRIPNDGDAISKIQFSYSLNVTQSYTLPSNFLSKSIGLELIKKVEVRVGNQLWQTLTPEDILARMTTEDEYNSKYDLYESITSVKGTQEPAFYNSGVDSYFTLKHDAEYNISGTIDLKIFSGSGDKLNTYLQVGAPNNDMSVKIYLNSIIAANTFNDISTATNFETSLIVKRHLLTDTEKTYVNKNVINSLIHTSQNVSNVLQWGTLPSDSKTEFNFTIDLSAITISASHLLIGISTSPYGIYNSTTRIKGGEGTYYRRLSQPNTEGTSAISPGIYDCLSHIELFVNGSSVTGKLPSSYLIYGAKKMLGLSTLFDVPYYCVPLASTKFGTDSLVMSKLSSKKLVLSTNKIMFGGGVYDSNYKILASVTAVGTNIVTYAGGNCSKQIAN